MYMYLFPDFYLALNTQSRFWQDLWSIQVLAKYSSFLNLLPLDLKAIVGPCAECPRGGAQRKSHGPDRISWNVQNGRLGQGSATGSARGLPRGCQGDQQQLSPQVASKYIPEERQKSIANHSISSLLLTHVWKSLLVLS